MHRRMRLCLRLLLLPVFLLAACALQLQNPPAAPAVEIEGLWVGVEGDEEEDSQTTRLLFVSSPGREGYPYRFVYYQIIKRELLVSGKRIYIIRRDGFVKTSATEALMVSSRFTAARRDQSNESDQSYWPLGTYGDLVIERSFETDNDFDLFQIEPDGSQLTGDEYRFRRAAMAGGPVTELDIGYVADAEPVGSGQRLTFVTSSPVMAAVGEGRIVWSDGHTTGRIRSESARGEMVEATVLEGAPTIGQIVVLPNFDPGAERSRVLSREEVLQRVQRGEPVSREDLIRALGQ